MIHLHIRPFVESDAADLAAFMHHWGEFPAGLTPADIVQQVSHCRQKVSGDLFLAFAAEHKEQIVGYLQMSEVSLVCFPPGAEVSAILVHREMRGCGIGSQLIAFARTWAMDRGLRRLLLSSQQHREAAHRFYERHGFRRWKESFFFELSW